MDVGQIDIDLKCIEIPAIKRSWLLTKIKYDNWTVIEKEER